MTSSAAAELRTTVSSRKATVLIPRVDDTVLREADHRARMALYLSVASLVLVPLALPALGLWLTAKTNASLGGRQTARVARNFAIVALVLWLAIPGLVLGAGMRSMAAATAARETSMRVERAKNTASTLLAAAASQYAVDSSVCPKMGNVDPWGNEYWVTCKDGVVVGSNGPDGQRYSSDDITAGP